MTVCFKETKSIDKNTKYLVFGYFREYHDKLLPPNNAYFSIQPLMVYICLSYYHLKYKWDKINVSDNLLIDDEDYVTVTKQGNCTVFLENEICSGLYKYRFKIINASDPVDMFEEIEIGIIPKSIIMKQNDNIISSLINDYVFEFGGYCYCTSQAFKQSKSKRFQIENSSDYGVCCKNGDIVEMIVDLNENQLKYSVNDTDFGKAFDIQHDTYRVAIYFFCKGSKIQLMQ